MAVEKLFQTKWIITSIYFSALLNLARFDFEEGKIQRPEFLKKVKEAVSLVQEGIRCKTCVKVARSTMTMDEMIDSMSESECSSKATSRSNSLLDLRPS